MNMQNVITLTTDFGWSEYVATMKGVILTINPDTRIIDINHNIKPQDVLAGAYVLYSTAPYFLKAIHVGVIDPGVGTEREGIIIECENGFLIGPDNGLLLPCARRLGLDQIYKITNESYFLDDVSETFHGRDIFAPVAAHISRGVDIKDMGEVIEEYIDLKLDYYRVNDKIIEGKINFVDNFGNLITSIPKEIVGKHIDFGKMIDIEIMGETKKIKKQIPFLRSYAFGKKGDLLATISSSGFFEISCNQGSAQRILNVDTGSLIKIRV